MFPELPSNLDNLAVAGILDFDAEAYLKGAEPRYMGGPQKYLPLQIPYPERDYNCNLPNSQYLPAGTKIPQQANKDEYVNPYAPEKTKKPIWKKILVGIGAVALLAFGGYKLRVPLSKLGGKIKTGVSSLNAKLKKPIGEKFSKNLTTANKWFHKIGEKISTNIKNFTHYVSGQIKKLFTPKKPA